MIWYNVIYIYIYVYMHMNIYVCVYIYIHMYTCCYLLKDDSAPCQGSEIVNIEDLLANHIRLILWCSMQIEALTKQSSRKHNRPKLNRVQVGSSWAVVTRFGCECAAWCIYVVKSGWVELKKYVFYICILRNVNIYISIHIYIYTYISLYYRCKSWYYDI